MPEILLNAGKINSFQFDYTWKNLKAGVAIRDTTAYSQNSKDLTIKTYNPMNSYTWRRKTLVFLEKEGK